MIRPNLSIWVVLQIEAELAGCSCEDSHGYPMEKLNKAAHFVVPSKDTHRVVLCRHLSRSAGRGCRT